MTVQKKHLDKIVNVNMDKELSIVNSFIQEENLQGRQHNQLGKEYAKDEQDSRISRTG